MPKAVGYSQYTTEKLETLQAFCGTLFHIEHGLISTRGDAHPEAILVDLNAGDGLAGGYPGSTLIMLREAIRQDLPFHLWACELEPVRADRLRERLIEYVRQCWAAFRAGPLVHVGGRCPTGCCPSCDPLTATAWVDLHVTVVPGDHNVTVETIVAEINQRVSPGRRVYGLVFGDGNGQLDFPITPLIRLSRHPRLWCTDILLYVNAAVIKRTRLGGRSEAGQRRGLGAYADTYLIDGGIDQIRKQYGMVRRPHGQQQWTFFALTNYAAFPKFRKHGFIDRDSEQGRRIIDGLNLAPTERPDGQLPFDFGPLIGPTPSTFGIPASEPSAPSSSSAAAASASAATEPERRRRIT